MKGKLLIILALTGATIAQAEDARLTPITVKQAVEEFDKICVANFTNKKRFGYELKKSDFGYSASEDQMNWVSPLAMVNRVTNPGEPEQCHFDASISTAENDRDQIAKAIETELVSELGVQPARLVYEEGMKWEWSEMGKTHSVAYFFGPSIPQRRLALTYKIR